MKVLQINIFGNLSTGKIAVDIYKQLKKNGHDGKIAFARNTIEEGVPHIIIGNKLSVYSDGIMTRLTDRAGCYSKAVTTKLISQIEEYDPDIIHLHNIHGYYINIPLLFKYLRDSNKPVVWTLHDCWAYTGHCCYYSMVNCDKWKYECNNCPQKNAYPASWFFDNSKENYYWKKDLFLSIKKLHLVCVSKWLESELNQSFLKDLPCQTIYNGIDNSVFRPTDGMGFRRKYGLDDKYIVLGVASTWDTRKGLSDFVELSKKLDQRYQIVLVGLKDREKTKVPSNILGIGRTDSQKDLVDIYSAANVFFNASVEETFGLPTVEALACGTPAIVYNSTALPETIRDGDGFVVETHDIDSVEDKIREICDNKMRVSINSFRFSKSHTYQKYIELYEELVRLG